MNRHKLILAIAIGLLCGTALLSATRQCTAEGRKPDREGGRPRSRCSALPDGRASASRSDINSKFAPGPEIPSDLVQQLIRDINTNENNFRLSKADLDILNRNLKCELHDLNGDGVLEFFLYINHSDWCGAGSNCSYWVYQKTEAGYTLLLEGKVLRVKETVSNGYRDLSSETPMGFCDGNAYRLYVTPYKYDGVKYQAEKLQVECRAFTHKEN